MKNIIIFLSIKININYKNREFINSINLAPKIFNFILRKNVVLDSYQKVDNL